MSSVLNYLTDHHTSQATREEIFRGLRWSNTVTPESRDITAFFHVRDRLLNQRGHGQYVDQIKDFGFNFDLEIATYSLPGTDPKYAIDLKAITDPALLTSLNLLRDQATQKLGGSDTGTVWSIKSKGNLSGKEGLKRDTESSKKDELEKYDALRMLSMTVEESGEKLLPSILRDVTESRKEVVGRHHFAEFALKKMGEQIDKKIEKKKAERGQIYTISPRSAEDQRRIDQLDAEVSELTKVKKSLGKIDMFAMTLALATHPVGTHWHGDIKRSGEYIRKRATETILQIRNDQRKNARKLWQKDKPITELNLEEEAYVADLIGMLHKGRGEYILYCRENRIPFKKEGLEDLFLREAIKFVDGGEYTAKGFKDAIHFEKLSERLKGELDLIFDDVVNMAKEAIGKDAGVYPVENYPPNATEEVKQETDKKWEEAIKTEINAQRGNIRWDIQEARPVVNLGNRLMAAAAAGTVIAGGLYTGIPQMAMQAAASLVWNNPLDSLMITLSLRPLGGRILNAIPSRETLKKVTLGAFVTASTVGALVVVQALDPVTLQSAYLTLTNNKGSFVALVIVAQATASATREVLTVKERETSELGAVPRKRLNKRRLALLLSGVAGATAAAYAISSLLDDEKKEKVIGVSSGVVDQGNQVFDYAYEHFLLTGFYGVLTSVAGRQVARFVPSAAVAVAGAAHSLVTNVAKYGELGYLAEKVGGLLKGLVPNISVGGGAVASAL